MTGWWAAACGLVLLAAAAALLDRRGRDRADLDRVALVDWRTVQLLALAALIVAVSVALHRQ